METAILTYTRSAPIAFSGILTNLLVAFGRFCRLAFAMAKWQIHLPESEYTHARMLPTGDCACQQLAIDGISCIFFIERTEPGI